MNQATGGWVLFIASIGMMCTLLSADVVRLATWNQAFTPGFIGIMMAHLGVVITAFIGGKLIPTDRDPTIRTRSTDPPKIQKQ